MYQRDGNHKKIEILKLRNSMNYMKNTIEKICSRAEKMEDRISELENRNFEITQLEQNKEEKNEKE